MAHATPKAKRPASQEAATSSALAREKKEYESRGLETPFEELPTYRQFMDFWWSERGYASLSVEDRKDIFINVLLGSSDLTEAILNELIENYGEEWRLEVITKPGEDARVPAAHASLLVESLKELVERFETEVLDGFDSEMFDRARAALAKAERTSADAVLPASSAHSPAPWQQRWNEDAQRMEIYSAEHDLVIANVYDPSDEWLEEHTHWDEDKMQDVRESVQANVNLMTAAPELLELAKQLVLAHAQGEINAIPLDIVLNADSVVATAEGRS